MVRTRKVIHLTSIPEVIGGDQQVLQRASDAQMEVALVFVHGLHPARPIDKDSDGIVLDREDPGLRVENGRRQYGVLEQELQPVVRSSLPGKVFCMDLPQIGVGEW